MKRKMFNLSSLKAFDSRIALNHHETIDTIESFSYRHIQNDSVKVKNCLDPIKSEASSESNRIWRQYNVLIAFSTHCPAVLPAIIG